VKKRKRLDPGSLDELIEELTAEAGSDGERIWNFQQALQKHIWLPYRRFRDRRAGHGDRVRLRREPAARGDREVPACGWPGIRRVGVMSEKSIDLSRAAITSSV
jgi:hypothetical protein